MKYVFSAFLFSVFALCFAMPQSSWSQVDGIDGIWYSGEEPYTLEVYDSGWRFSVRDQAGNKSHGKAFNEEVIYWPAENITGQIEFDATIIEWSDGTFWAREPFTGELPPGVPEQ